MTSSAAALLLEIRDAAGAFERLDAHLRASGFFDDGGRAARGRSADVYLGFALSEPLRRSRTSGAAGAARPAGGSLPDPRHR